MNSKEKDKIKRRFSKWFAIVVFVGFIGQLISVQIQRRKFPYRHPEITAASYIAPKGCAVREYKFGEPIAESCADGRYLFEDYQKYGLRAPGRRKTMNGRKCGAYYRIGSDLVAITCIGRRAFYARDTEKNVFIVR
jgi:hypothetical protein